MKPILVEWEDAASQDEWVSIKEVRPDALICRTVGFLVFEDKNYMMVASTDEGDRVCCTMQIPRKLVVKIYSLTPARRGKKA
jgi:hypothetical protein